MVSQEKQNFRTLYVQQYRGLYYVIDRALLKHLNGNYFYSEHPGNVKDYKLQPRDSVYWKDTEKKKEKEKEKEKDSLQT